MKITYAKNKLGEALRDASPILAQTAIRDAEKMLAAIENDCLVQLDARLAEFATEAASTPEGRTEQIRAAYNTARSMIGVGTAARFPAIDAAAKSLCDVADGLLVRGLTDWAAIRAHLDTMRLLRMPELPAPAATQLLQGLDALRGRFAVTAPPPKRPEAPVSGS